MKLFGLGQTSGNPTPRSPIPHPLLFHAAGTRRLGTRAAALFARCERGEAIVYAPAAVLWETSLPVRVGRVHLRCRIRVFFDDLFSNPAFQSLDLTPEHVYAADDLGFSETRSTCSSWRLPRCSA